MNSSSTPLVSIIIPAYQTGAFIEAAIGSVLSQDYSNIELIVIDGGSTDGSLEIIKKFQARISYWLSEPDSGQAQAINKGLRQARGEILGWLNADDLLAGDAVSRVVDYFTQHADIDVVYGNIQRIDGEGNPITYPKLQTNPPIFDINSMLIDHHVSQPGSFWRREIMEKTGLLDESYHYVLDYAYWVRLALNGARFVRLEGEPLASFRISDGSKTSSHPEMFGEEELRLLDWLVNQDDTHVKLGLNPNELKRRYERAKASACMRTAISLAKSRQGVKNSRPWMIKAIRTDPAIILTRPKWVLIMLRALLFPPGEKE